MYDENYNLFPQNMSYFPQNMFPQNMSKTINMSYLYLCGFLLRLWNSDLIASLYLLYFTFFNLIVIKYAVHIFYTYSILRQ